MLSWVETSVKFSGTANKVRHIQVLSVSASLHSWKGAPLDDNSKRYCLPISILISPDYPRMTGR